MDPKLLTPVLLGALVLWVLYRRTRRSFGRQPVSAVRLCIRAGILGLVGALLLLQLWRETRLVEVLAGGIIVGAALALVGLRHTRFERVAGRRFYTPHTYIGVLLIALFFGRVIVRFARLYESGAQAATAAAASRDPLAVYRQSPLTLGLIGLLVGYYVCYNLGVLSRTRELADSSADLPAS